MIKPLLSALPLVIAAATAQAQSAAVSVQDPWVRGTVAQQKASGAFMTITSPVAGRLVSASSPVAGVTEIHEMTMDGQVMRMRAVDGLDLPAGRAVQLKPGGYHVMLMELKQPLKAGETVPITLVIERAGGAKESIRVNAPVRPLAASAAPMEHQHNHKH
jgi:copper(I)-binding protein